MQIQGSKNSFRPKKPKLKDPKSALSYDNIIELLEKDDWKDKCNIVATWPITWSR